MGEEVWWGGKEWKFRGGKGIQRGEENVYSSSGMSSSEMVFDAGL